MEVLAKIQAMISAIKHNLCTSIKPWIREVNRNSVDDVPVTSRNQKSYRLSRTRLSQRDSKVRIKVRRVKRDRQEVKK